MIAALLIFGTLLFLTACRLEWIPSWVYLGRNDLIQVQSEIVLTPRHPEILAGPLSMAVIVSWGLILVGITALLTVQFKKVQPTSEVYHE